MNRRSLLFGTVPLLAGGPEALAFPAIQSRQPRVTQAGLADAIHQHTKWLMRDGGSRAVFANHDLSGLHFGSDANVLIDLHGADFTEADMSGVTGGLVSFGYASLFGARLTSSRFFEPGFICANLSHAICDRVEWGCPMSGKANNRRVDNDGAVFHHTRLTQSNFSHSRLRGHFVGARFSSANLARANFSFSDFSGEDETSFFAADLTGASFTGARLSAVRFAQAKLDDAIFKGAQFGMRTIRNLSRMGRKDILKGGRDDQIS